MSKLDQIGIALQTLGIETDRPAHSISAEYYAQEYTRGGAATAERTQAYVRLMCVRGTMSLASDGELTGIASDGERVNLGHILTHSKKQERKDWERLGAYLYNHPLPEHW